MDSLKIILINSFKPLIYSIIYFLYYTKKANHKPLVCILTYCIYIFFKEKKNRAIKNIKVAFSWDTKKAKIVYRQSLNVLINNFLSFAFIIAGLIKEREINDVHIDNLETLKQITNSNKGAIAISGHIGNFPLMLVTLAHRGYPLSIIYRESKYFGGNIFKRALEYYNITAIAYSNNNTNMIKQINRSLKDGKILFFLLDQKGKNSITVKLFNRATPVFYGPFVFAKKTGANIIPIFTHFNGRKHIIDIFNPFPINNNLDITANIQIMITSIENYISAHPDNWNWTYYKWT